MNFFGGAGELVQLALVGVGAALTSFLDKTFVNPIATKVLPSSGVAGTLVDGVTTWVTAVGVGMGVGLFAPRYAGALETGGKVVAVAKGISAFVPNYTFDATLPIFLSSTPATTTAATAAGSAALPAGSPANSYGQPNSVATPADNVDL